MFGLMILGCCVLFYSNISDFCKRFGVDRDTFVSLHKAFAYDIDDPRKTMAVLEFARHYEPGFRFCEFDSSRKTFQQQLKTI